MRIPKNMRAAAIDRFGGPEVLHLETLPVPTPGPGEILLRVRTAGVGVWDPMMREGRFDPAGGRFPRILGSDGAGTVAAVGPGARRFKVGDRVYASGLANPKGGFYAEYVALPESSAAPLPSNMPVEEAGALAVDGLTALSGLNRLQIRPGSDLLIYGASGGVGHLALQLAKRLGARVLAVASGADGVSLVRRLGADAAADGRHDDVRKAIRAFSPEGLDAALVLAGGHGRDEALELVRDGGRIAYPHGVPPPRARRGLRVDAYDGELTPAALERLNELIRLGPFHVELGHLYPLERAAQAHRDVLQHHLGKLALAIHRA